MSISVEFFNVLLRYEIELWNRLDDTIQSEHGISLGRLQALQVVSRHGGNGRVNEVAAELRITVGAASKLVDRLEVDGTATRGPNPDDRRSSLIALTPAGADLLNRATTTFEDALSRCIPPRLQQKGQLAHLTSGLTALLHHLNTEPDPRPASLGNR